MWSQISRFGIQIGIMITLLILSQASLCTGYPAPKYVAVVLGPYYDSSPVLSFTFCLTLNSEASKVVPALTSSIHRKA